MDLYHWILNDTSDLVEGSGSIFQTWIAPDQHSAVELDGESFAFLSPLVPRLVTLFQRIDVPRVMSCYSQWLHKKGRKHIPAEDECEYFVSDFHELAAKAADAVEKLQGLMWVAS